MAVPSSGNVASQVGTLVVTTASPEARVSQAGSLVVTTANSKARVSQVGSLVVTTANPKARVSQVGLLVISPAPKVPPSVPPGAQTLSWWKLDEAGLGQPAQDAGPANVPGYDNNSTTHAATTAAPLNFLNAHARNFPGGSVGLFVDSGAAHNLLDNFTVSAWVKPASFSAAMAIMSRLDIPNGAGWNVIVNSGGTAGVVNFHAMNGAGIHSYAGVGGTPLVVDVWSHVVAVMRAGTRYIYINGVVQGSSDSGSMAPTTPTTKTYIGEWASTLSAPWSGDLDDVRYYDVALSDAQIQFLAGGFDLTAADMVGYWKLDEVGTGQVAYDSSLLRANAPDQAGASVNTTTPAPIAAPTTFSNPRSRSFPAPPLNWLNAGIQAVHGFTQNFTVACWYRSPTSGLAAVPLVTHQNASPTTKGWGLMVAPTVGGPGKATLPAGTYVAVLQACTAIGPTLIYADVGLQLGVWTHIAGVFYASTGRLFVNGVKQSAVLSIMPAASTDLPTYLGRDYSLTGGPTQIIGDLDEVRIYKVALTDEQISSLAAGSEPFATIVTKTHNTDSFVLAPPVTVTKTHITDSQVVAGLVTAATFVQRDNWRNGAWIGSYGSQGYEVIYSDNVNLKPPWVTYAYFYTSGGVDSWARPGIYTDPRFFQCAGIPAQTSAGVVFAAGVGEKVVITYLFDIDHVHAVSIAALNVDIPSRRYHINVYNNDTDALLDGPRDVGDYCTTDVYMTWNVSGHVRFECVVDNNLAGIGALFIDLPRAVYGVSHSTNSLTATAAPASAATFVQRDNWRNGDWIGHYGTQGYVVYGTVPDLMPPGVSWIRTGFSQFVYAEPHTSTDPRLPQIPGEPTARTGYTWYTLSSTGSYAFLLDDGLVHSVSILFLDFEPLARRFHVQVYDADTNVLIAGRQDSDDYGTKSIYMTWNVSGHVRFDVITDPPNATTFALFVDPPRTVVGVSHSTSSNLVGNLIGYWKLDETGTGQVAVDSSPLGTNATDTAGTSIASTPAPVNFSNPRGRSIVNYDTYLDAGVQPAHNLTQNFTVSGWVRHRMDENNFATILAHNDYPHTGGWSLLIGNGFRANFYAVTPAGMFPVYDYYGDPIPPEVWVHLAGVAYDSTRALFVNGRKVTVGSYFVMPAPSPSLSTYIGKWFNGSYYGNSSAADFDDIRLYNVALTDDQIQTLAYGTFDPFAVTATFQTHSTSSLLLTSVIQTHGVDSLLFTLVIKAHGTDADIASSDVVTAATFVQRDNWRNGTWIGQYGAQGYAVFGSGVADLMPAGASYSFSSGIHTPLFYLWGYGLLSDLRYPQVPDQPIYSVAAANYLNDTWSITVSFTDSQIHAVSLFHCDIDNGGRRLDVNAYDADTNALLAGPQASGDYATTAVYLTWNVRGRVRFDIVLTGGGNSLVSAIFIDPPRSVGGKTHSTDALISLPVTTVTLTHGTDASLAALPAVFAQFVQRDNWRNGAWIGQYGSQGYSLFLSGYPAAVPPDYLIPDVMPPGISYTLTGPYGTGPIPAVYTDPRYLQDPTRPGYSTVAWLYNAGPTDFMVVLFDDDLVHAVTLFNLDYIHVTGRFTITVYDNDTGDLLDGPREVGDFYTTGVYFTWNVRGHIRFHSITLSDYAVTNALFIDPPMSIGLVTHSTDASIASIVIPPATASFVQRDNWRNGAWKGAYGSQGVWVIGSSVPILMPPGASFSYSGFAIDVDVPPGIYTDPRFYQIPGDPVQTMYGRAYTSTTGSFTFNFEDGLSHAVTISFSSFDAQRLSRVEVYDNITGELIGASQDTGDYQPIDVHMTWNVSGSVRFDVIVVYNILTVGAIFVDPPMSVGGATHNTDILIVIPPPPATTVTVTHGTNSRIVAPPAFPATAMFVQRDNWRGGAWINAYGSHGHAVFLSGTPTVLPPGVSSKVAGGKYDCWLPPGTYTDQRLPQVPGQPDKTAASVYHTEETECFFFNFDDGLEHAVSIFSLDYDQGDLRHQISVYNDSSDTLLDGPREVDDQYTNSVYMTWNVSGHIRFELVTEAENAVATAWFIDPPISVRTVFHGTNAYLDRIHAIASFLQRDNWRNGFWINAYGSQGYSVFGAAQPDIMPPGTTYSKTGGTQGWWQGIGIWTDPRYQQVPNHPEQTVGAVYWSNDVTESFTFLFDDSLVHAVSIYTWSNDTNTQRQEFLVYDADTNELIDGPQASGETNSHGVYMTWNVRGHVRFDAVLVAEAVLTSAVFVDPPMSIGAASHYTDNLTSLFAIATYTVTQKTDSFLRQAIVGSRSRSQRVGTRTLAFGD